MLLLIISLITCLSLIIFKLWLGRVGMPAGISLVSAGIVAFTLASLMYDLCLFAGLSFLFFMGNLLLVVLLCVGFNTRLSIELLKKSELPRPDILTLVMLLAICAISGHFIAYSGAWGRWDAWAIWNMHAKFLTTGTDWKQMVKADIAWSHADYPLLLPSWVAMLWQAEGNTTHTVPYLIAYGVCMVQMLCMYWAFGSGKVRIFGVFSLLIVAINAHYFRLAAAQYADTLLSLLILLSLILASYNRLGASPRLLILMGFIAASAGWCKNEGLLFFIVFSMVVAGSQIRSRAFILPYLSGAIVPILFIALYKGLYAPANDIVTGQNADILHKLSDWHRYVIVGRGFAQQIHEIYPVVLFLVMTCLLVGYRSFVNRNILILVLMLVGYFFTFILTPRELQWHVENASDRLFLQLFPSFIYVLMNQVAEAPVARKWMEKIEYLAV